MTQSVDIAIIGGGATGCALALGLQRHSSATVALIDAGKPPTLSDSQTAFDQRTIALSAKSLDILKWLGCEQKNLSSSPIQHIHVSDKGHAGQALLHADDYRIDAFGQVVSLAQLGYQLYNALNMDSERLLYLAETQVLEIERNQDACILKLDNNSIINCKLVVMADGGRSPLSSQLGFRRTDDDYEQTAFTFTLTTDKPHNGWAYERFTESGPLALLPLDSHQYGVVWTVSSEVAGEWSEASDKEVITYLQNQLGYRCGIIKTISDRASYPLALKQVTESIQHRCVVVGNAAQALHPIAGQGVNLGFRDVADLIRILQTTKADIGAYATLNAYKLQRHHDKQLTISMTDLLVRVFSNQHLPMVVGRNLGLTALNLMPAAKKAFAQTAMGKGHAAL